jgi:hypothetical protein
MSGQPPDPSVLTLFPEATLTDLVHTWYGTAVVAENVGYAHHAQVLEIVHCKSKREKDHKDIRFKILLDGRISWILTDRNVRGSGSTLSSSSSPFASSTDLTGSVSSQDAYDRILIPALGVAIPWPPSHECTSGHRINHLLQDHSSKQHTASSHTCKEHFHQSLALAALEDNLCMYHNLTYYRLLQDGAVPPHPLDMCYFIRLCGK